MSQYHPDDHSDHDDNHDPGHEHDDHNHDHEHEHEGGLKGWLLGLFSPHEHGHYAAALDPAMSNARGIWAVKVSLIALLATALFQVIIVAISGSVALLADTIHNFSDALTAIPLWIAFTLARRPRNDRYTYGYGRAEDLAGVLIVVMIFLSAIEVFQQSIERILHPQPIGNLGWVAAAAIIGFIGNEAVAIFRTRVGREIGSAALVADGLHARTDGFTSLGVLVGVIGVALGFPLADPLDRVCDRHRDLDRGVECRARYVVSPDGCGRSRRGPIDCGDDQARARRAGRARCHRALAGPSPARRIEYRRGRRVIHRAESSDRRRGAARSVSCAARAGGSDRARRSAGQRVS